MEIQWRYMGDIGEIKGRYRGDIGPMEPRAFRAGGGGGGGGGGAASFGTGASGGLVRVRVGVRS